MPLLKDSIQLVCHAPRLAIAKHLGIMAKCLAIEFFCW